MCPINAGKVTWYFGTLQWVTGPGEYVGSSNDE